MLRIRLRRIIAPSLVFAVAACGGGGSSADEQVDPIDAVFGTPATAAEQRALGLQHQEAIADCMREAGWEYTPFDLVAAYGSDLDDEQQSAEFGSEFGYGVTRRYELYEWPNIDAEGNWLGQDDDAGAVDPNDAYVDSLSPEDQEAYATALYGEWITREAESYDAEGNPVSAEPPIEDQGCTGQAYVATYGGDQAYDDATFTDRMFELRDTLDNDPAIEQATIVWSDCMYDVDPDYDFDSELDPERHVDQRLQETKGLERVEVDGEGRPVAGGAGAEALDFWATDPDGTNFGYVGQEKRLTEAEIGQLQAFELELWENDQKCRESSELDELRRRREEEIASTLKDEFPQFANGAEGNGE
jgi:hypothetical protein